MPFKRGVRTRTKKSMKIRSSFLIELSPLTRLTFNGRNFLCASNIKYLGVICDEMITKE
jgi:hypothetical protein